MGKFKPGDLVRLKKGYGWIGLYPTRDCTSNSTIWSSYMLDYETFIVLEVDEWYIRSINLETGREGWCGKSFVQGVE